MKKGIWRGIYGIAPDSFHNRLMDALEQTEEKEMKKGYRLSTVLIAAAVVIMMTGAALAAGMGLFERVNEYEKAPLPDSAKELVQSDLGGLTTELFDLTVEEAMTDRQQFFVQVRLTPKNPEEYALMWEEHGDPEADSGVYLYGGEEQNGGELIGRADGKKIVLYNVYITMPWVHFSPMGGEVHDDGSVTLVYEGYSDEEFSERQLRRLNISCSWGVHGEFSEEDAPEWWDWEKKNWLPEQAETAVAMENNAERRTFRMEAVGESEKGILQFMGGEIEFSPLRGYYTIRYDCEGVRSNWLWFADADGQPIESRDGYGDWQYDTKQGTVFHEQRGAIQTFDPLPEMLILELTDVENNRTVIDRLEVKLIPEE